MERQNSKGIPWNSMLPLRFRLKMTKYGTWKFQLSINPGLAIANPIDNATIIISNNNFPTTKETFKQFFTYKWQPGNQNQNDRIVLGCQVRSNKTLNQLKHENKPNKLLTWIKQENDFLEADELGAGHTKMIRYLTHIHPRIINRMNTKQKLQLTLEQMVINHQDAAKLDPTLNNIINKMHDEGDKPSIQCPPFKLFPTTIGIGTDTQCTTADVIKCQSGKTSLLHEFLIKTMDQMETNGLGKFIPAGLVNMVGTNTMTAIICTNNQYLKLLATIPINGIPEKALKMTIIIDEEAAEADQVKVMALDYILLAKWCLGLKPAAKEGYYLLITTTVQIAEAHQWLDDNMEGLFVEHIPSYATFKPIDGYPTPEEQTNPDSVTNLVLMPIT